MAFDAFLKISTIPGESTDDKHKNWIEVISYSWQVTQRSSGSVSSGGGRTAERADLSPLSIVKTLDKASPKLFLSCVNGEHIQEVTLALNRAGGDKQKYMEYKLSDVTVADYQPGGHSQSESPLPEETVSFAFGKVELTYTETDHATGKPKGDVKSHWDLKTNKGG
jgi:type VI secretion system secreted protein Hcp